MKQLFHRENLRKGVDVLYLLPIIFAVAVIPLIVRITFYDPKLSSYSWFSNANRAMDMFMYYKNNAMMLLDAILLVLFVLFLFLKKLPADAAFLPLGLYFLLVVLSAIFSVAPEQTWHGFYDMMESAFVVFGYCMVCYYTYAAVRTEAQVKIVLVAFLVGVAVMCAIAASQFFCHDFYMTDLGKSLIFPSKYSGYKDSLSLAFGEGRVYASLYNPNYVGVYSCILIPLLIVLTFTLSGKWRLVPYLLLACGIMIALTGSLSKTAIIAIIPCLVFAFFYFGKRHWKKMIFVYALYVALYIVLSVYQATTPAAFQVMDRLLAGYADFGDEAISDITLGDDNFTLTYRDNPVVVQYLYNETDGWYVAAADADGSAIPTDFNDAEDGFVLQDARFDGLEFIFGADASMHSGFSVTANEHSFFIYYDTAQGTYYYTNHANKAAKLYSSETVDVFFFHLMGGFSGRGYIWSKTLPLLKKTLFIGSGPDTYAFMFPQYDYVSLVQNGWEGILITKPHSMYLQMAVQTGGVSLLAFLAFYLAYFFQAFRLYRGRALDSLAERAGAAVFLSSICFMIASVVNDSTPGVSVIFWGLLGLGFACNRIVKKTVEKNVIEA